MAITDVQPDALAEVYAQSLFQLADAKGGRAMVETTLAELEELAELGRQHPGFGEFLRSRVLPVRQRAASLDKILKGNVSDLTLRFLQVVNQKERMGHLQAITAAYDALVQHKFGRVEVDVYTASPISPEELRSLRERLQAAIGREPIIHPYTDNEMLGGVKIQIGDRLIDASLATQLRRFREQLRGEGAVELRSRMDRIIDDAGQS
jgi:F-type H+-transporting ATPase subunit delta